MPPYQSLTPEPHGDNIAALRLLAKLINHELVFLPSPNFARCQRMLDTGDADIVAGVIASPERQQRWILLPYRQDSRYLFLTRPGGVSVARYEDLLGHSIAVSRNTMYFDDFDNDSRLKKEVVGDLVTGVRMLLADRVDVVIAPENALPSLAREFSNFAQAVQVSEYGYQEDRVIQFALSRFHRLDIDEQRLRRVIVEAFEQSLFESALQAMPSSAQ
nr:transporter substrate-binding domain-containing protein [Shewanella litorisediminis]